MNTSHEHILNEDLKMNPSCEEDETGNRYPEDEDRVQCRKNLLKVLVEKGVSGKQVFPHEFYNKIFGRSLSSGVRAVLNAQWNSMRDNISSMIEQMTEKTGFSLVLGFGDHSNIFDPCFFNGCHDMHNKTIIQHFICPQVYAGIFFILQIPQILKKDTVVLWNLLVTKL